MYGNPRYLSGSILKTQLDEGVNILFYMDVDKTTVNTSHTLTANLVYTNERGGAVSKVASVYVYDVPPVVVEPPPITYYGLTFEVYITWDNGRIRCIPKVLENNSPFTIESTNPFTQLEGGVQIPNMPKNLSNAFRFFTVEQNPVNGYSNINMTMYSPRDGLAHFIVPTALGANNFRKGLIPNNTLINTVRLKYTP